MTIIILIFVILVISFGFVIMFGAPYLPTLTKQKKIALEMLDLKEGQVLVELGSGDGRMLKEAAKQGIYSIGYELNPLLVLFSNIYCWKYKGLVSIRLANFWKQKLPECDGVYVFLLDKYMEKLNKKVILESKRELKLVSFAFKIKSKRPITERDGMYLYKYNNR